MKSMLRLRSWASSMISVSYWRSIRSPVSSASRMPSVISLTSVFSPTWSVKRTFQPTTSPSSLPSSSAMRAPTVRAARRRGWVWPIMPAHAAAQLQADLRDLRGLPGARLPGDDHDLVVADRGRDLVAAGADGQRLGVADGGNGGAAGRDALLTGVEGRGDAGHGPCARVRVAGAAGGVEPAADAVLVV